jgi:uncharacterized DUF497 family protein
VKLIWDENKNQQNSLKHSLNFKDAELVFEGPTISFHNDRFNYGEARFITLGKLVERILVIVHAQRDDMIRIISMRKANEREQKIYQQRLEKS